VSWQCSGGYIGGVLALYCGVYWHCISIVTVIVIVTITITITITMFFFFFLGGGLCFFLFRAGWAVSPSSSLRSPL